MSATTLALRAPDYIKITASLIAAHGWCGSIHDPIGSDSPLGLDLSRAVLWAVAGEGARPRDLDELQGARVDEVLEHLEGPRGLNMSVVEYEREFAGTSAQNIAWELAIVALRYETDLAAVA